jgi:HTH-type transcriptional regulator/antitoxin HigA
MASSIYRIHSEAEYDKALGEYESYFDSEPEPDSEAARRFETLGLVLADYESRTCPVPAAEPAAVLRFVIESNGRSQSDLAQLLGSRSRASEYLNGRRDLSLEHIKLISREWHVPADALIGTLANA